MASYRGSRSAGIRRRRCTTTRRSTPSCNGRNGRSSGTRPYRPSRSQAIIAARQELDEPTITQVLELLTNLWSDVLVAGIEIAKMPLKTVDFFEREFTLAERFHAFHDVEQPASRFQLRRKIAFCYSSKTI